MLGAFVISPNFVELNETMSKIQLNGFDVTSYRNVSQIWDLLQ